MIKKVVLHNFKQFKDKTFELNANALTLLAGSNNSGKSTLLEALSTWEFCKNLLVYAKGKYAVTKSGRADGLGVTLDEFTPINIPSFKYLWTNLNFQGSYTLSICCYWDSSCGEEKYLSIGLSLTQERLFIKKKDSNVEDADCLPRIAYLPTFAGISKKEQWYSPAMRNMLIGQGLAGSVLRNQIIDLYNNYQNSRKEKRGTRKKISERDLKWLRENDSFLLLNRVMFDVFKGQIQPAPFNASFHTTVYVDFIKGEYRNKRFTPFKKYNRRDIMVEGRGFLQWLSVYTFALSPNIDVLLLDEPDAHLHPSLQVELLDELRGVQSVTNRQILIATHSSEILKDVQVELVYSMNKCDMGYLKNDEGRLRLLSGIGTEYFPLMDAINKSHKILFVENKSDADILSQICSKYSEWPNGLVVWSSAIKHKERKVLFCQLNAQLHDLRAVSLSDRDNEVYDSTTPSLHDKTVGEDLRDGEGVLLYRKWRRWEIESYLLVPSVIARLIQQKRDLPTYDEARNMLDEFLRTELSIVIQDSFVLQSEMVNQNKVLFEMDAKALLEPICREFNVTKYEIIQEMRECEIAVDIKTFLDEIISFLAS